MGGGVGCLAGGGVWFLRVGSVGGGFRGRVGGGVWFPHSNCVCGVCVREWYGLRIELGVEIGCSVAGALVGGRCVGELVCVRVCVFAEWSGSGLPMLWFFPQNWGFGRDSGDLGFYF